MIDDVTTVSDPLPDLPDQSVNADILELLRQLYDGFDSFFDFYGTDLQNRDLFYDDFDVLSTKIDNLNGNIVVLNDNVKSLSSFLVGGFSIIFVLALAYALFNNLFK